LGDEGTMLVLDKTGFLKSAGVQRRHSRLDREQLDRRVPRSARRHQETETFWASYAARAEIEGTHAQAIHCCGLRRCRCIGLAKAHSQHMLTAAAVNLVRVAEWRAGTPIARTRCSRSAVLQVT